MTELDRVEIVIEPRPWRFAAERRADIEKYFERLCREHPGVWNGRVLLLNTYTIEGRALRGTCFETDYASFCSWRDWDFPDATVHNFFAAIALRTADGAFLVGEMASSTANAGLVTFPCGTPEPGDLDPAGVLALEANLDRELMEETGIAIGELSTEPGWTLIRNRGFLAFIKRAAARENADALRARVMRHLAHDPRPEFADIRIVRSPADFEPEMPAFITAFLLNFWS